MRRLVVCANGTWRSVRDASDQTNVERLCEAVPREAPGGIVQLTLPLDGVGTGNMVDRLQGGALGIGLDRKVKEAYRWIVRNYRPGDEIYLFGFSRGAYTVRSLAGFVNNLGVLRPEHANLADEAYDHYRDRAAEWKPSGARSKAFREANSWPDPRIRSIGVWDTVGSLGVPFGGWLGARLNKRYGFHDVQLSRIVEHAFHALAIDEKRAPFAPTFFGVDPTYRGQHVEQVWFAGCHSDVGGGTSDRGLSDIALQWMVERVREKCGLVVDADLLKIGTPPCDGTLSDSFSTYYRLLGRRGRHVRPILARQVKIVGENGSARMLPTHDEVHPTAEERQRTVRKKPLGPYDPENLVSYLRGRGVRVLAGRP